MPILDELPAGDFEPLFFDDHSDVARKAGEHSVSWAMRNADTLYADTWLAPSPDAARRMCHSQITDVKRHLESRPSR